MKIVIYALIFAYLSIDIKAQNIEHILKAYPSWTTDFTKTKIDFNEIISGGPPKDGIPALVNPKFTTVKEAENWIDANEPIIAVSLNNISRAYPLSILIFHEIVNDRLGRTPVLITFCPLCYSAIVYDRTIINMSVNFGVSGLLRNSDMIMYDQLSESFWQQFTGEAIVGDFTGYKLKRINSQIISFSEFKKIYPNGLVLSKNTGYRRPYGRNPYINYDNPDSKPFLFSGKYNIDLPPNSKVIGVSIGKTNKAYPYDISNKKIVINDSIMNHKIVVFHVPGTKSALDHRFISESKNVGSTGVFYRKLGNYTLTFKYINNEIGDEQTNSKWSVTGTSYAGKLKGAKLRKIQHGDYFAFAWFSFHPESDIFKK